MFVLTMRASGQYWTGRWPYEGVDHTKQNSFGKHSEVWTTELEQARIFKDLGDIFAHFLNKQTDSHLHLASVASSVRNWLPVEIKREPGPLVVVQVIV